MLLAVVVFVAGVFCVGLTTMTGVLVGLPVFAVVAFLPVPVELTPVLVAVLPAVAVEVLLAVAAVFPAPFWLKVFEDAPVFEDTGVLEGPVLVGADCFPVAVFAAAAVFEELAFVEAGCFPEVAVVFPFFTTVSLIGPFCELLDELLPFDVLEAGAAVLLFGSVAGVWPVVLLPP